MNTVNQKIDDEKSAGPKTRATRKTICLMAALSLAAAGACGEENITSPAAPSAITQPAGSGGGAPVHMGGEGGEFGIEVLEDGEFGIDPGVQHGATAVPTGAPMAGDAGLAPPTLDQGMAGVHGQDQIEYNLGPDGYRSNDTDNNPANDVDFSEVTWSWNGARTHLEPASRPDSRIKSGSNVWRRSNRTGLIRMLSDQSLDGATFRTAGGSWTLSERRAGLYVADISESEVTQIAEWEPGGDSGGGGRTTRDASCSVQATLATGPNLHDYGGSLNPVWVNASGAVVRILLRTTGNCDANDHIVSYNSAYQPVEEVCSPSPVVQAARR